MSQKKESMELPSVGEQKETPSGRKKSLEELIETNIKWSQTIFEQNKRMKRRLGWIVAGEYVRLALIVIPLILAVIYLPPLFKDLLDQYGSIFSGSGRGGGSLNDIFSQLSPEQIQQALKSLGNSNMPK